DNPQVWRFDANPCLRWFGAPARLSPGVAFLRAVPDGDAAIEFSVQHLAHRRRRPRTRPTLLRSRRRGTGGIELLRDRDDAFAASAALENLPNDRCFVLVDPALLVTVHRHLVISEHAAAGHVARLCLLPHRVVRPLPRL